MHVCLATNVIEGAPPTPEPKLHAESIRDALLSMWSVYRMATSLPRWIHQIKNLEILCYYAIEVPSTKRRTSMDVPKMVADWKAVIVTLCTAHSKDDIDKAEFRMDELLTPILSAPVKELREFYAGLRDALKEDERVPFFIWSMFNAWGKIIAEKAPDDETRRTLRKKLAGEIAEMVEDEVRGDVVEAITGALMWRDPPTLRAIKDDLQAGAKPRLRGRESCLFLTTERGRGKERRELHTVML